MNYGHGADQGSRIGYTLKNVQRIPADMPEGAGVALAEILGGNAIGAPADPLMAAQLAPLAAAQGATLVYGAADDALDELVATREALIQQSPVVVVIADEEPAYAIPAAYAAAHFRVPVVTLSGLNDALGAGSDKLLLVAAPERLVPGAATYRAGPRGIHVVLGQHYGA